MIQQTRHSFMDAIRLDGVGVTQAPDDIAALGWRDPVRGCVVRGPTRWPGQLKLLACPERGFEALRAQPGVTSRASDKRPDETGWYIPQNVWDMGRLPALLHEYAPDPLALVAPGGFVLDDHQRRAVAYLRQVVREREGALLGADMGLGKTLVALYALWLDGYLHRSGLVCAPKLGRGTWCGEGSDAWTQFGLKITPLEGVKDINTEVLRQGGWFFCHYDILEAWRPYFMDLLQPASIIFDESHYLANLKVKSKGSTRSFGAYNVSLMACVERRYGLTGTPLLNHRLELWSQLAMVQPRQWGSHPHDFGVRWCAGQRRPPEEGGGWSYDGESRSIELRARLAGTLLFYSKKDSKLVLPALQRTKIEVREEDVPADLMKEYSAAQRDIAKYLEQKQAPVERELQIGTTKVRLSKNDVRPEGIQLVCMTTLIGLLSQMKLGATLRALIGLFSRHNHVVVFSWRVDSTKWLAEKLQEMHDQGTRLSGKHVQVFGPVHGGVSDTKRWQLAKEFSEAEAGVYLATLQSVEVSINHLACASAGLFQDLYWNTSKLVQGEGRVWRRGNPHANVEMGYVVMPGSIDDIILGKLLDKAHIEHGTHATESAGIKLVQDLRPHFGMLDKGDNLDLICARLMGDDARTLELMGLETRPDGGFRLSAGDSDGGSDDAVPQECDHEYDDEGVCTVCGELHPGAADNTFGLEDEAATDDDAELEGGISWEHQ